MIYLVIPLSDDPRDLKKIAEEADPGAYVAYAPRVYFVRFTGTAQKLAEKFGFAGGEGVHRGIVARMGSNFGFASKDLWGWIGDD